MDWTWRSACVTDKGKRRANNEDSVLNRPTAGLWAVADGMGGHMAGDYASQAIADALNELEPELDLASWVDQVEDALVDANDHLRSHARSIQQGQTIGSTVVTMVARDRVGVALWAGDSRLYRCRAGDLSQITRDHNPISDLLELGAVSEEDVESADTNVITRAVGGQSDLHLDVAVFEIEPEDTYLLCSDGLYRELPSESLAEELSGEEVREIAERLLELTLEGAARDNVSVVVIRPELA